MKRKKARKSKARLSSTSTKKTIPVSSVMRSKFTTAEIEEVTFEYQRMLDAAISDGNKKSINALVQIIADLHVCVKHASDGYNKDED